MESTLVLLGGGGGGGGGGSPGVTATSDSTMSEVEAMVKGHVGMMATEKSSYQPETELELGLGLSVGGGGVGKLKSSGWGERCRILTAKDFPSVASHGGSSSSPSCRFSGRATNIAPIGSVSGTKRAADSVSQEGGSPTAVSQVVGWPPIRAYRMNSLVNQSKTQRAEEETEEEISGKEKSKDGLKKKICDGKSTNNAAVKGKENMGFVKVNMDGVLIGRKVDLNAHSCYETLSQMLEDMFFKPSATLNSTGGDKEQAGKIPKLLDGNSDFVLTYEDKDGDWMLVGDVPFRMFVSSVKKLRIMRTAEANGLAPRSQERSERQRIRPI